jgi:hypothetical protein
LLVSWELLAWLRSCHAVSQVTAQFNIPPATHEELEFSSSLPVIVIFHLFCSSHSFCCSSVTKSCPTLCSPMDCHKPGPLSFTVSCSSHPCGCGLSWVVSQLVVGRPYLPALSLFPTGHALWGCLHGSRGGALPLPIISSRSV